MNDTVFDIIRDKAGQLKVDISAEELAAFAADRGFTPEQLSAVQEIFSHLAKQKHEAAICTLLRTSRLPIKQPKTFENFDFTVMRGKYAWIFRRKNTAIPAKRKPRVRLMETVSPETRKPLRVYCFIGCLQPCTLSIYRF